MPLPPPNGGSRLSHGRTPQHFQRLYQDKLAAGLSPTTVSHLHTVLHGAFSEAVRWSLLPRNVVSLVRPPRKAHVEVVALTVEQARALLAAAAGNRFEALFALAVKTGMRRGELLALRWEDVDLDKGMLQVRGPLRRTREGTYVRCSKDGSISTPGGAVTNLGGGPSASPSTPGRGASGGR